MSDATSDNRRKFLKGLGVTTALGFLEDSPSAAPQPAYSKALPASVMFSTGNEIPDFPIPNLACDCHHHIFNNTYPADKSAKIIPPTASVAEYRLLQKRLGLKRNVIVQPSTYGTNNALLLQSLAEMGNSSRGVCVVDSNVTDRELEILHAAGVRGVRFNLSFLVGVSAEMMLPLSHRIAPLGWSIHVNGTGKRNLDFTNIFRKMPSEIVFDHLGQLPQPEGINHPSFKMYADLLSSGKAWMKLSGLYITSRTADYSDTSIVARKYIEIAPDRLIWGTDWPHTSKNALEKPDDAKIIDQIAIWTPSAAIREKILVTNPAALYGFY